jgi:hypothetical protein
MIQPRHPIPFRVLTILVPNAMVWQGELRVWMAELTQQPAAVDGSKSFADLLESGELLCDLANAMHPHAVSAVARHSTSAYKWMDNITRFLAAYAAARGSNPGHSPLHSR